MTRQAPPHIAGEEKRKDGEGEDVKDRKKRKEKRQKRREKEKRKGGFLSKIKGKRRESVLIWGNFCIFFGYRWLFCWENV